MSIIVLQNITVKFKSYILSGGTRREILDSIENHTYCRFQEERSLFNTVHDADLKAFAIQKSLEYPNFKFVASHCWINQFKMKHKISSRKVVKLVKKRTVQDETLVRQSAINFQNQMKIEMKNYSPDCIWNTDQTAFQYELVSTRTLSNKGEKTTMASAVSPKNKVTHSYTVQYIISQEGEIVGDCFVCLQVRNASSNNLHSSSKFIVKIFYFFVITSGTQWIIWTNR